MDTADNGSGISARDGMESTRIRNRETTKKSRVQEVKVGLVPSGCHAKSSFGILSKGVRRRAGLGQEGEEQSGR
jgi:hypothetical protein